MSKSMNRTALSYNKTKLSSADGGSQTKAAIYIYVYKTVTGNRATTAHINMLHIYVLGSRSCVDRLLRRAGPSASCLRPEAGGQQDHRRADGDSFVPPAEDSDTNVHSLHCWSRNRNVSGTESVRLQEKEYFFILWFVLCTQYPSNQTHCEPLHTCKCPKINAAVFQTNKHIFTRRTCFLRFDLIQELPLSLPVTSEVFFVTTILISPSAVTVEAAAASSHFGWNQTSIIQSGWSCSIDSSQAVSCFSNSLNCLYIYSVMIKNLNLFICFCVTCCSSNTEL